MISYFCSSLIHSKRDNVRHLQPECRAGMKREVKCVREKIELVMRAVHAHFQWIWSLRNTIFSHGMLMQWHRIRRLKNVSMATENNKHFFFFCRYVSLLHYRFLLALLKNTFGSSKCRMSGKPNIMAIGLIVCIYKIRMSQHFNVFQLIEQSLLSKSVCECMQWKNLDYNPKTSPLIFMRCCRIDLYAFHYHSIQIKTHTNSISFELTWIEFFCFVFHFSQHVDQFNERKFVWKSVHLSIEWKLESSLMCEMWKKWITN